MWLGGIAGPSNADIKWINIDTSTIFWLSNVYEMKLGKERLQTVATRAIFDTGTSITTMV